MEGREVFKRAVRAVVGSVETALANAGLTVDDIDVLLPHQANIRIIEAVCQRLGIPMEKTHNVIEDTGNTSAASIPLAMAEADANGVLVPGAIVCMTGFGAGMAWATAVVRW
jgi:3-oxoacyl-[acyl-carrier-protein] synthase-3